jgi:hypothetical protein
LRAASATGGWCGRVVRQCRSKRPCEEGYLSLCRLKETLLISLVYWLIIGL